MKVWIKTDIVGKGTEDDPRRPYLPVNLPHSMLDLGNECLARVTGKPEDLKKLVEESAIKLLKDEEARQTIKSKHPNSDLEDLDIADIELEELARAEGLDPNEIKRDIQIPTRGKRVLQCQEMHLLRVLAKKKDVDLSDLEEDIELGSKHAFNRALARLREKTGLREVYKRVRK